ncbi:FKBP-type peptidyl-prolyl cis-trans isomerase [Rurimicrobium arvi]|uniref:Peptidyl-prolyl cis-trans isomerase n=1 Tax=Rurimicrobium arvi TaxID=2049916 RepID=A0ABP8MSB3_9BACT
MLKQVLSIAALAAIMVGAASCNKGGFKKTKDGVEYNIVKDEKGDAAKIGDYIEYHMVGRIGDSLMFDSRKMMNGKALEMELQRNPATPKAMDPTDVITMLSAGDSAVIRFEMDSMARKMYTFAKPTDKIQLEIKMVSVKTKAQFEAGQKQKQAEMEAQASKQVGVDDQLIQEYLSKNGISAQKSASGVYYIITKPGAGENATAGKTVKVKYTGKTMDGKVFDSNIDPQFQHTEPLEFILGQRQVIAGWDEGISLLNKGAKATLFIPSGLAYGAEGREPQIPANSILIFDVELLDFK